MSAHTPPTGDAQPRGGSSAPMPGGGVPSVAWEAALTRLDDVAPDERTEHAHALLTRLEDALEAL